MKEVLRSFLLRFVQYGASDLKGLIRHGTFKIIDHDEVADGSRIFGSRFLDIIKYKNCRARPKRHLVRTYPFLHSRTLSAIEALPPPGPWTVIHLLAKQSVGLSLRKD